MLIIVRDNNKSLAGTCVCVCVVWQKDSQIKRMKTTAAPAAISLDDFSSTHSRLYD